MIKNHFLYLLVIFVLCSGTFSQYKFKLKEDKDTFNLNMIKNKSAKPLSKTKSALPYIYYSALLINPMLVIEDKKVYFGLTKEVSFGYFPFGRIAFEYSFIVRDRNTSHLRLSYNYDLILEASDFAAFMVTPGAGYFTDTENKGWFVHASFGILLPIGFVVTGPYIRYRHTFLQNKPAGKTDIDDISLGMGFIFYLNE